jgi:predicted SprT family Zn-dependent metalloprotease
MQPTTDYLKERHTLYNEKYFNGKLKPVGFSLRRSYKYFGLYMPSKSTIAISVLFDRSDKEIDNTLIHEMIHQYIWESGIKDSGKHGRKWLSIAKDINKDGWDITPMTSSEGLTPSKGTYATIAAFMMADGKCYTIRAGEGRVEYFNLKLMKCGAKDILWYKSKDAKDLLRVKCRLRVRGYRISVAEYKQLVLEHRKKLAV